jgi:PIN domain nuclease of toxin-antitoxin system
MTSPEKLGRDAAKAILDGANIVQVSAASAWEIATKARLGKLPEAEALERAFLEAVTGAGYAMLAIDAATALRAGRIVSEHRDPFDRMIAAQALDGDMPVISGDTKLDMFGLRRIW